ncbi:MAG TPA: cation-efflux pump [Acidobacteriaceae bacterium]|nr:cation-efflux pump [Acidobacteriaceae bacterium]
MSQAVLHNPARNAVKEKSLAAALSVTAAGVMAVLKLIVGLLTGSLGMLSDAAHSGIDLAGAILTLLSVRVSDKPADEDHPYGHAKVENLSAFIETFLMLASSVWITAEAIVRIFIEPVTLRYSFWPLLVLALSMAVDFWRSRHLKTVATRYQSDALAADAFHFASDIWSSAAVFIGLCTAWAGHILNIPWLRFADPIAAIVVAILILHFGWRLAWRTVAALTDSVSPEMRRRVLGELQRTNGVLSIDQARMRRAGNKYFADFTLSLPRQLTFQRVEDIVCEATNAVQRVLPEADVVIHTVPRSTFAESVFDRIRAVAARNNVTLHEISVQSVGEHLRVEQHLEVNENLSLSQAHSFVRRLEDEIRIELPHVGEVLTHIENEPATIETPQRVDLELGIEAHLRHAAAQIFAIVDIHEVAIRRIGDKLLVSCHCTLPDDMPMQQVHEVITALEDRFKLEYPEVYRMLIHPEPATDNRH